MERRYEVSDPQPLGGHLPGLNAVKNLCQRLVI